ncbi:hypothetical protein ACFQ6V_22445 [Streptomyces roseifaciens]
MDALAANTLAKALHTDFDALPHRDRNLARFIFLDPAARVLLAEWRIAARGAVSALRLYAGRHPHDHRPTDLIGELSVHDEDFRQWWAEHDVLEYTHGTKRYHHPLVGEPALDYESLTLPGAPDQALYLYTAEPGSRSAHALRLLGSLSASDCAVAAARLRRDEAQGPRWLDRTGADPHVGHPIGIGQIRWSAAGPDDRVFR